eukprot:TRINITY_DN444_c0_g2_i1.p1 TRINITY_DN444_c0_g2~~TRINITY_DN444_c0_g2_i1.p1  ORF type:complete len:443 (-),score=62.01 TRINITY_DN444_c0_g2_i1:30-1358(-)
MELSPSDDIQPAQADTLEQAQDKEDHKISGKTTPRNHKHHKSSYSAKVSPHRHHHHHHHSHKKDSGSDIRQPEDPDSSGRSSVVSFGPDSIPEHLKNHKNYQIRNRFKSADCVTSICAEEEQKSQHKPSHKHHHKSSHKSSHKSHRSQDNPKDEEMVENEEIKRTISPDMIHQRFLDRINPTIEHRHHSEGHHHHGSHHGSHHGHHSGSHSGSHHGSHRGSSHHSHHLKESHVEKPTEEKPEYLKSHENYQNRNRFQSADGIGREGSHHKNQSKHSHHHHHHHHHRRSSHNDSPPDKEDIRSKFRSSGSLSAILVEDVPEPVPANSHAKIPLPRRSSSLGSLARATSMKARNPETSEMDMVAQSTPISPNGSRVDDHEVAHHHHMHNALHIHFRERFHGFAHLVHDRLQDLRENLHVTTNEDHSNYKCAGLTLLDKNAPFYV